MLVERIIPILESGQTVELKILSGSMLPTLPPESLATIAGVGGHEIERGDIIVYANGDTLVAHRLLLGATGGRGPCFEKGDNNPRGQWIRSGRIIGIVTHVRHQDGPTVDLRTPESRRLAERAITRSLRADLRTRILFIPRRIAHWLRRT